MSAIRAQVIEALRRALQNPDLLDVNGDVAAQTIRDLPQGTFADEDDKNDARKREVIERIRQDSHWRGSPGYGMFR